LCCNNGFFTSLLCFTSFFTSQILNLQQQQHQQILLIQPTKP
jgi:hypothetical protein